MRGGLGLWSRRYADGLRPRPVGADHEQHGVPGRRDQPDHAGRPDHRDGAVVVGAVDGVPRHQHEATSPDATAITEATATRRHARRQHVTRTRVQDVPAVPCSQSVRRTTARGRASAHRRGREQDAVPAATCRRRTTRGRSSRHHVDAGLVIRTGRRPRTRMPPAAKPIASRVARFGVPSRQVSRPSAILATGAQFLASGRAIVGESGQRREEGETPRTSQASPCSRQSSVSIRITMKPVNAHHSAGSPPPSHGTASAIGTKQARLITPAQAR